MCSVYFNSCNCHAHLSKDPFNSYYFYSLHKNWFWNSSRYLVHRPTELSSKLQLPLFPKPGKSPRRQGKTSQWATRCLFSLTNASAKSWCRLLQFCRKKAASVHFLAGASVSWSDIQPLLFLRRLNGFEETPGGSEQIMKRNLSTLSPQNFQFSWSLWTFASLAVEVSTKVNRPCNGTRGRAPGLSPWSLSQRCRSSDAWRNPWRSDHLVEAPCS